MIAYIVAFVAVAALGMVAAHMAARISRRAAAISFAVAVSSLGVAAWVGVAPGSAWVLATSVALLVGGSSLGALVGARIDSPGHLLPVVVVSSLVDLASVLHPAGPSANLVESPRALALLAVWFPLLDAGRLAPILGVGDIVFAALYVAAIRRHGLSLVRVTVAAIGGLLVTMVLVILTAMPLPALPLLGIAVVLAIPEARRIPAADRRNAWLVMVALAVIVAALLVHRCYASTSP
ncbi:MAG: hypothetical protein IT379_04410 [Deltaproteobacteria bacterium]|nr:hypothetical protein [Deltaproteobacteria bacterium]